MTPTVMIVTAGDDWQIIYFVSNISDRKVWEGHDYGAGALEALSETFGYPVEYWDMTNEDEHDGCTPDTFGAIEGKKKP
jgi:hypothetical protein